MKRGLALRERSKEGRESKIRCASDSAMAFCLVSKRAPWHEKDRFGVLLNLSERLG